MSGAPQIHTLESIRTDGWYERLDDGSSAYRDMREVVGDRFVAFAAIAGVRIVALAIDRRTPDASLVDFTLGDSGVEQRLPLGEFRRRLAAALLNDDGVYEDMEGEITPEKIQRFIGSRYLLLAPVFKLSLRSLRVPEDSDEPRIRVEIGGMEDDVTVEDLRSLIRERIRAEIVRARPSAPFSIDLARVPEADAANARGDFDRTVELLGAWPGPLSLLLRTPEGQNLAPEAKATLTRALGLLGTAYVSQGRFEWAEEVLRLGVQWGQDGKMAADLYRRLGDSCLARERFGEAIGLYRRALTLGASPRETLPELALAYTSRKRFVAAMVCVDEAIAAGASADSVREAEMAAAAVLGGAWKKFRDLIPPPAPESTTLRPPPR